MRLVSAIAFIFLILVFFICFSYMLYMMWYALQVIKPPENACKAPFSSSLCNAYNYLVEGVKRIFAFVAVMLLLAFIICLIVLWVEQKLWEARTYLPYRVSMAHSSS